MPGDGLNLHAVSSSSLFGRPKLFDEFKVLWIVEVHLSVVVVLELRVLVHLSWDLLASEAPHALDFEIWNFVEDANSGKAVLSEVIKSLKETFH